MSYIIESNRETERLHYQNQIEAYCYQEEYSNFSPKDKDLIVDLGCAAGEITMYLAGLFPNSSFIGVDFSSQRIKSACNVNTLRNCSFLESTSGQLPFDQSSIDVVISRFLFQHLDDPFDTLKEVFRVLKPNGQVRIVETYKLFTTLETNDIEFNKKLEHLKKTMSCNVDIGRELPEMLLRAGFSNIHSSARVFNFNDSKSRSLEYENNKQRLFQMRSELVKCFGDELSAERFSKQYLEYFEDLNNPYWFEKTIISASKS